MDPIPHNFYYDPLRQGSGRGVWNWYSGSPFQTGGYLTLLNAKGVMYYDCGKGNLSFTLNIPNDPAGENRQWGLKMADDYVLFDISANTFQAKTNSTVGGLATSVNIPWDAAWTGADVNFMIRWEAGRAVFYINQIVRAQIADASIPYGPMSPYIFSDGGDLFLLKSVVGQGLQTLVLNPVETASDAGAGTATPVDKITITEAITAVASTAGLSGIADAIVTSEAVTAIGGTGTSGVVADTITSTEAVTLSVQMTFPTSVADTITTSEAITAHTA